MIRRVFYSKCFQGSSPKGSASNSANEDTDSSKYQIHHRDIVLYNLAG